MIPELITGFKFAAAIGGGWLARLLITKWLGKTKEEAEIVLNWEEIHAKRDKKLLLEIERLEGKIDEFMREMILKDEGHRREILRWEADRMKNLSIIKEKDIIISNQEIELESLRKD